MVKLLSITFLVVLAIGPNAPAPQDCEQFASELATAREENADLKAQKLALEIKVKELQGEKDDAEKAEAAVQAYGKFIEKQESKWRAIDEKKTADPCDETEEP